MRTAFYVINFNTRLNTITNLPVSKKIPKKESLMIKAISLFPNDADADTVDAMLGYLVSSLKQTPGVQSITTNEGNLMSPGGPSAFSRVVEFTFDSLENMMTWTQSQSAQTQKQQMSSLKPVMIYFEEKDL
jgi:hypothetical protein